MWGISMDRKTIADKLYNLYNQEQIYANPIQTRPKPKAGITGQKPDDEEMGVKVNTGSADEEDVTRDLGNKGSDRDLGKGDKDDIGSTKKSTPKIQKFKGAKDAVHQEESNNRNLINSIFSD
jgi:hypothetical protein